MNITDTVAEAILAQINNELQAHYNYLQMSAHFESTPYHGFAHWFRKQSEEEYGHAMKFYGYLLERGGSIQLNALQKPSVKSGATPLDVFRESLSQEQKVTDQIQAIYELASEERDYMTVHFLGWFLEEQREEEDSVSRMIERLELVGDNVSGLLRIDGEAGAR